jgi:hypothetical protein
MDMVWSSSNSATGSDLVMEYCIDTLHVSQQEIFDGLKNLRFIRIRVINHVVRKHHDYLGPRSLHDVYIADN